MYKTAVRFLVRTASRKLSTGDVDFIMKIAHPDAVLAFCAERLADYKRPRSLSVTDALPMTATGKVKKHELRRLQADMGLLKDAIEEIVRWTSPIIHFGRTATQDYTLRDKVIKEGQSVALFYPSANRDEEVFEDPYTFRIDRRPNRHIGFGVGEHFCLGAHLARLEMEVAYRHLLPRIDEIELTGPVDRLHSSLVGGVKRLPIRYKLHAR